jgi:diguanylate cyclase (GGDEF)-like protein
LQLDSFTILVSGCSLLVLLGAVFLVLWVRDRSSPWLLWWGLPFVLGGGALVFYMRPGWDTDFATIAFGNAARMFALGCLWQGIRVFQGRKPALGLLSAMCGFWIALSTVPDIVTSMTARVVIVSLLNSVLCAFAAYEIWRDRKESLASRWPAFAVFVSFAAVMAIRAGIAPFTPFPVGSLPLDAVWLGAFMLVTFGHATFAAILFLAMTMERRVAEQRNFALSDPLTGLQNRRAFADFALRTDRRRAGMRNAIALLALDLDHFKEVNDRFGHDVGDRMLKSFADIAEANVRPSDQLFRMGGEEFCFALPETNLADAIAVAERIRRAFEVAVVETRNGPATATVSIGIAATQHAVDAEVLHAAADSALYEAKARGRNRVVVAEPASLLRAQLNDIAGPTRLSA